jgi:hypothetical protein
LSQGVIVLKNIEKHLEVILKFAEMNRHKAALRVETVNASMTGYADNWQRQLTFQTLINAGALSVSI